MSFSSRWGNPTTLKAARAAPPLRGITSGPCCERPLIAFTGLGREAALRRLIPTAFISDRRAPRRGGRHILVANGTPEWGRWRVDFDRGLRDRGWRPGENV